jgi:long-chain acyl-CoA synthetase
MGLSSRKRSDTLACDLAQRAFGGKVANLHPLHDLVASRPHEVALDDFTRRRTWGELEDRTTRIARLLRDDFGLEPGSHVALLMYNRVEIAELVLGAMIAGIWLTPINYHFTAAEVAYVLEDSGARVLFVDPEHEEISRAAAGENRGLRVVRAGEELDAAIARASAEPLPLEGPPGSVMIYTSGTTGRPKGVKRLHATTVAEAFTSIVTYGAPIGLDGSGPHLVTGPLYHSAPLLFAVYDLIAGAPLVIMPRWDAERTLELITERRIRHTHLVPTMFVRLLRFPDAVRAAFDASSLTLVLHGAAPIARHVKQAMIEWWGEVLVEYWGATESGVCTLVGSCDWLERPGTVGRAVASFEVFAADAEGRRLPADEVGTLFVRHKRVAQVFEYHGAPEKTAEVFLQGDAGDGGAKRAFNIGDLGYVDADGYVFLSDRKSHTIISGGVNIYPAEIEQVIQQHPAVGDVAVFGIPDEEWGESVKAAVELVDGRTPSSALEADILAFARGHLAAYKVPRSIDFEERLPRHPTGKLYTRLLRDRYWEGAGRKI